MCDGPKLIIVIRVCGVNFNVYKSKERNCGMAIFDNVKLLKLLPAKMADCQLLEMVEST